MESGDVNGSGAGENEMQMQSSELVSQLCLLHELLLQLKKQQLQWSDAILSQLLCTADNSLRLAKSYCASGSPHSDMSCQDLRPFNKDDKGKRREGEQQAGASASASASACKKRKMLPRWHSQVRMGSTGGVEGPLDDGHSWRKYGQKDILGAKHPRAYYRCTFRNSQGCLATKQLQRTDDDPTLFHVIYQGTHTCSCKPHSHSRSTSSTSIITNNTTPPPDEHQYLNSLKATLTIQTNAGPSCPAHQDQPNSITFSFPSTPAPIQSCQLASNLLPSFANSPATSESNYFSASPSPYGLTNANGVGSLGFRKVDSDLTEVISGLSAAASTTTSTSPSAVVGDVDFVFEGLDFELDIDSCSFQFLS